VASHHITYATKIYPHRHIAVIGNAQYRWSVTEARAAIKNGDSFYTVSPSTGARANIEKYTCPPPCGILTLRTDTDRSKDNNFDHLPDYP
jgi:hypothetical protein